jgi:hypothetical protein
MHVQGSILFYCSSCPNDLDTERNVWESALRRARDRGWTARHKDDCWKNYCPRCSTRKKLESRTDRPLGERQSATAARAQ